MPPPPAAPPATPQQQPKPEKTAAEKAADKLAKAVFALASINNMALLLQDQGKLGEAEPLYREALDGRRRTLGDSHPDTLTSINNLESLLQAQGKLGEAEPLYREALDECRLTLGDAHADTTVTSPFLSASASLAASTRRPPSPP